MINLKTKRLIIFFVLKKKNGKKYITSKRTPCCLSNPLPFSGFLLSPACLCQIRFHHQLCEGVYYQTEVMQIEKGI